MVCFNAEFCQNHLRKAHGKDVTWWARHRVISLANLVGNNEAIHIRYWAGFVRMERSKQSAHIKLPFHLHISNINANKKSWK
jgi:hypothetical protein